MLLGEHPTSVVAYQILLLIGQALNRSLSFNRKFELVSGWSVLRGTLPGAWDPSVHVAAFDVLLGRLSSDVQTPRLSNPPKVACPYIFAAILASLDGGLTHVAKGGDIIFESEIGAFTLLSFYLALPLPQLIESIPQHVLARRSILLWKSFWRI